MGAGGGNRRDSRGPTVQEETKIGCENKGRQKMTVPGIDTHLNKGMGVVMGERTGGGARLQGGKNR